MNKGSKIRSKLGEFKGKVANGLNLQTQQLHHHDSAEGYVETDEQTKKKGGGGSHIQEEEQEDQSDHPQHSGDKLMINDLPRKQDNKIADTRSPKLSKKEIGRDGDGIADSGNYYSNGLVENSRDEKIINDEDMTTTTARQHLPDTSRNMKNEKTRRTKPQTELDNMEVAKQNRGHASEKVKDNQINGQESYDHFPKAVEGDQSPRISGGRRWNEDEEGGGMNVERSRPSATRSTL